MLVARGGLGGKAVTAPLTMFWNPFRGGSRLNWTAGNWLRSIVPETTRLVVRAGEVETSVGSVLGRQVGIVAAEVEVEVGPAPVPGEILPMTISARLGL